MCLNRSFAAGVILLIMTALPVSRVQAQSNPSERAALSLQEFYQRLVEHYDPSSLPKDEERVKVMHEAQNASAEDISRALPWIFTALAHQDDRIKLDACAALLSISLRPDSAALLRTHIKPIGDLLNSPNERLQGIGVDILSYLKPLPPPEAAAPLLAFLKRTDADPRAQAGAIGFLARHGPDNLENVGAVLDFLDRPLDREARVQALDALGTPQVTNPNIIDRVIAALDDTDSRIRFTAAEVLPRMGRRAVLLARPTLERLAEDPDQPNDVREEVRKALEALTQSR